MTRRALASFLALAMLALVPVIVPAAEYPTVSPDYRIRFPEDEGSHPAYRTEWWYVTGWTVDEDGKERGFQVTFFRHRPGLDEDNPSPFAVRQLLFAHAAISDPGIGRLLHDERSARAGFGLAEAREGRTDVLIEDWSMQQAGAGYRVSVPAKDFRLDLDLMPTQPPLLQGSAGYSQKGPDPSSASHYYSLPQLEVSGTLVVQGREVQVTGTAWFDHEWSSTLLDESAQGWDWLGVNLDNGGSLMAFRMRDRQGGTHWVAGTVREASGQRTLGADDVEWTALGTWRSPRTGIEYPVAWRVRAGDDVYTVRPMFDDQESDSRRSTGTIYWEGAVEVLDPGGESLGKGYLELTGYGTRLRM